MMNTRRLSASDLDVDAFRALIDTDQSKPALANRIESGVPIFNAAELINRLEDEPSRAEMLDEWAECLMNGAGAFVIEGATPDASIIDDASAVLFDLIYAEKAGAGGGGDHFAAAGLNDRLWNSLEKHALASPESFARYYANPWIAAASEAWLGPRYQMTAQVNLVHPGGQPQTAHRDYHLGFMKQDQAAQFPLHAHLLTAALTLQGAIAHVDIPIEAGPTKLLPHSQKYELGYLAYHEQAFREVFEERFVQVALNKGDLLWFNPATFHAAGENRTPDVERLVNLFQVSSAFGRPMETVDRSAMLAAVEPVLTKVGLSAVEQRALVASTAEGYAFPLNLDTNPPVGGLAPQTDQERLLTELG
ncbi:MAG: phytanoyl-CoA dioxygenase [Rhodospirillaceae bacterium]|nr:phytanoyl-CoA dioxygenase [Rhodospirillaceae bacterium]